MTPAQHRELAKIEFVRLGFEEHNLLTFHIGLKLSDGCHQSFGGYQFCESTPSAGRRTGSAAGMDMIYLILRGLGARDLDALKGVTCWVLRDAERGPIVGLAQLETEGKGRFLVSEWKQQWFPGESK